MKTAISLPDSLFEQAESTAHKLGISRSTLFVKALEEYLNNHNPRDITDQLNQVYDKFEKSIDKDVVDAQILSLDRDNW